MSYLVREHTYSVGGIASSSIDRSRIRSKEDRKLRVPGEIYDQVTKIQDMIFSVIQQYFPLGVDMFLTELVVAEALDNLVCHGFVALADPAECLEGMPPLIDVSQHSTVVLTIVDYRDRCARVMAECTLSISDQTPPFDDSKVFDPDDEEIASKSTGRGTFMIRALGATVRQVLDPENPRRKTMEYSWRQRSPHRILRRDESL